MFHLVDFCRLCLSFKGEFSEICNDYIMEKVVACIKDLEFEDRLPALICSECLEKLDMFFDFRNRCLRSEFLLHNYIKKFLANTSVEFVNTKLQVNVFKDFAAMPEVMGNVKIRKDKTFIKSKSSQDKNRFAHVSVGAACKTQGNEDTYINYDISSEDDDDIFLEDEDEIEIMQQMLADNPECEAEGITVKRKSSNNSNSSTRKKSKLEVRKYVISDDNFEKFFGEQFNKNSENPILSPRDGCSDELDPSLCNVVTDITERVKLRKRQVQLRAQGRNYCELYDESLPRQATKYENKQKFENTPKVHLVKNKNKSVLKTSQPSSSTEKYQIIKPSGSADISEMLDLSQTISEKIKNILKTPQSSSSTEKCQMIEPSGSADISEMLKLTQTIPENTIGKYFENNINTNTNTQRMVKVSNSIKPPIRMPINMGIPRIQSPIQDTIPIIPIATATDYEDDIAAHHLATPRELNVPETLNAANTVKQLYETNFENLLRFHLTHNEKPKETKIIPYKLLQSSTNQPIKVVTSVQLQQPQLPAEDILTSTLFVVNSTVKPRTNLHTLLDKSPLPKPTYWQNSKNVPMYRIIPTITSNINGQNVSVNFKRRIPRLKSILLSNTKKCKTSGIKSTANGDIALKKTYRRKNKEEITIPSVPVKTISNHTVLLGSSDIKTEEDTKVIVPFIPQNFAAAYTSENIINPDIFYENLSYSRTETFSETQPDFNETLVSVTQVTSQEMEADFKETQNDEIHSSSSTIEETSNVVQSQIGSLQFDHNYSRPIFPTLKELLSDYKGTETPQLKKLFDKVEEVNPNVTKDLLISSRSSPHVKKFRESFKGSTEHSKLLRAGRIKKKYSRRKRDFAIDDPLNVLKLFKRHRGKYRSPKKCTKKTNRSSRIGIPKKTTQDSNLEYANSNLITDTIPLTINQTNYNDESVTPNLLDNDQHAEVDQFDSDDSEIDVVTVPEGDMEVELEEINPIISTTLKAQQERFARVERRLKAQQERIARVERRKLMKLLHTIIPRHINNRQNAAIAKDILCSAKEYIKVLQCESQRLEKEQDYLIEKKESLIQKLSYLKTDVDIDKKQ